MAGINYNKTDGVEAGHRSFSENAVSRSGSSTFVGGSTRSAYGHFKIPEQRFVAVGHGSANPVASNASEDGRALNRRTDIKVVLNTQ
jgi:hypothetical protein